MSCAGSSVLHITYFVRRDLSREGGEGAASLRWASCSLVVHSLAGYDYGTLASSPCESYGGSNLCGAAGSPVSMRDLACTGSELSVGECSWSVPDAACSGHALDSVVFCGEVGQPTTPEGAVRLLSDDGAPSLSGTGALEVHIGGAWSSVCGVTPGAAAVACKLMGFAGAGAAAGSKGALSSSAVQEPRVGDLDCGGSESSLLDCSFREGDDVFCAPAEAALVSCAGEGDTTGRMGKAVARAVQ